MTPGKAIVVVAKELNWRTTEIAYHAGVTEDAVRRWRRGEMEPRYASLKRLIAVMPGLHARLFPADRIAK